MARPTAQEISYAMQAANLQAGEFASALNRMAGAIESDVSDFVRSAVFRALYRIIDRTPIDTGRARAAWNCGFSAGSDVPAAGEYRGDALSLANEAVENIGGITGGAAKLSGDTIYIYNNVEYIEALEAGHSRQAPAGMVALSMAEFAAHLQAEFQRVFGG